MLQYIVTVRYTVLLYWLALLTTVQYSATNTVVLLFTHRYYTAQPAEKESARRVDDATHFSRRFDVDARSYFPNRIEYELVQPRNEFQLSKQHLIGTDTD